MIADLKQPLLEKATSSHGELRLTQSIDHDIPPERILSNVLDDFKKLDFTLAGHTKKVYTVDVSKDGKWIVSGGKDCSIRVWDVLKEQESATLKGHKGQVNSLVLSSNSLNLFSASSDFTIKHWANFHENDHTTFEGHKGSVLCIALSTDEKTLITGSEDTSIIVWDISNKSIIHSISVHNGPVTSIKFFQNSQTLVSCSQDNTIQSWNIQTKSQEFIISNLPSTPIYLAIYDKFIACGHEDGSISIWKSQDFVGTLEGHKGMVNCLQFSQNGKFLVSASSDKTIKIWNVEKSGEETTLYGHQEDVFALKISSDEKFLASVSADNTVKVWFLQRTTEEIVFDEHQQAVNSLSVCSQSQYLVSGSNDGSIIVWNLKSKDQESKLGYHDEGITCVHLSKSGKYCASGSKDATIKLWDFLSRSLMLSFETEGPIFALKISDNDEYLAYSDKKTYNIRIFSIDSQMIQYRFKAHTKPIWSLDFDSSSRKILSASADGEIKLWDIQSASEDLVLKGHESIVTCALFSIDEDLVFSGSFDKTVRMWSVIGRNQIMCFEGHKDRVLCLDRSRDRKYIVSGSADNTVKVWNIEDFREEFTLFMHKDCIRACLFSYDMKFIISASKDCMIKLWQTQGKIRSKKLCGHSKEVNCIVSSADGLIAVSGSDDTTLAVWDLQNYKKKAELRGHRGPVLALAISRDSRTLISGSKDKYIISWDLDTFEKKSTLKGHASQVNAICLTENSSTIYSASHDKTIRKWDIIQKSDIKVFRDHTSPVLCLSLIKTNNFLASGSENHTILIYNLIENTLIKTLENFTSPITTLSYSHNEKDLISGFNNGTIKIFSTTDYKAYQTISIHKGEVKCVFPSYCGKYIYSASADHTVKIWNLIDHYEEHVIKKHSQSVNSIHINAASNTLLCASDDSTISIFKTLQKYPEYYLKGHKGSVFCVAASNSFIASASEDNTVKLWNLKNFKEEITYKGHSDRVLTVIFTHEGTKLISGGKDKVINVWKLKNESAVVTFVGHEDSVNCLALYRNDEKLVSGSNDKKIKLWDMNTYACEHTFYGHTMYIYSVAVSENMNFIASASGDKTVAVWDTVRKNEKITLNDHTLAVYTVKFVHKDKYLITASSDKNILLWNLTTKTCESKISIHRLSVLSLATTVDDNFVISASADNTIKVSSFFTRIPSFTIKKFEDSIKHVALTPNGEYVITALDNSFIHVTKFKEQLNARNFDTASGFKPLIQNDVGKLKPTKMNEFQDYIQFYNVFYSLKHREFHKLSPHSSGVVLTDKCYTYTHFLCQYGQGAVLKNLIGSGFVLKADSFGHSPLYYSIINNDQECTDILFDFLIYLSRTSDNSSYITSFNAVKKDFPLIIKNISNKLPELLASILYTPKHKFYALCQESLPLIAFSKHQNIDLSNFPIKILDHSKGHIDTKGKKEKSIIAYTTSVPIPDTNGTKFSLQMLESIVNCGNPKIFSSYFVKFYLQKKFDSTKILAYFLAFLLFINVIVALCLFKYGGQDFRVFIFFAVINGILFLWELVQMRAMGLVYFMDLLNLIDLVRLEATVACVLVDWFYVKIDWLTWIMVALNIIRAFTALRVFECTRHYLSLISKVLRANLGYMIFFVLCNFAFGIMLTVVSKGELNFSNLWVLPYEMSLGIYYETESISNPINYGVFLLGSYFMNLVFVLIFIPVLGDSVNKYLLEKDIINMRGKAELILEIEQILYSFRRRSDSCSYLQICEKSSSQKKVVWQGQTKYLENTVKKSNSKLTQQNSDLQTKLHAISTSIDNQICQIEGLLGTFNEKVENRLSSVHNSLLETFTHLFSKYTEKQLAPDIVPIKYVEAGTVQETVKKSQQIQVLSQIRIVPKDKKVKIPRRDIQSGLHLGVRPSIKKSTVEDDRRFTADIESLNRQSIEATKKSVEEVFRNSINLISTQDRTEETHGKLQEVHKSLEDSIERELNKVRNTFRMQVDEMNKNIKSRFETLRDDMYREQLQINDSLAENKKAIEESIKQKIELKTSSIEGNIKKEIKKSIKELEEKLIEMTDKIESGVVERIDSIAHLIDEKMTK